MSGYIHGFTEREQQRLNEQAEFLEPFIYPHVTFSNPSSLLEIGCGVGAQTRILLRLFPKAQVTAIDASDAQLAAAQRQLDGALESRVKLAKMSAERITFADDSFDAAFICWLLEHVSSPAEVAREAFRMLKPGGETIAVEVQNSSLFLSPECPTFMEYWQKLNRLQLEMKGDPFVGSKLGNLFSNAGFSKVNVTPVNLHFDATRAALRAAFLDYWFNLSMSAAPQLTEHDASVSSMLPEIEREFTRLRNTPESVFLYTFFVAKAIK